MIKRIKMEEIRNETLFGKEKKKKNEKNENKNKSE